MSAQIQITFDCQNPARLARFWAQVLGYVVQPPPEGYATWDEALGAMGVPAGERDRASALIDPRAEGPRLFFQKVPEAKIAKNRVHLDVRAAPGLTGDERMAALEARATELTAYDARILRRHEPDRLSAGFIVMADPEGNEFCLD